MRRRCISLPSAAVSASLEGVTTLVVAPAGPLLSLPFEVLLTGPADPANLADAPWLVRKFTLAHVPAPSNFVSLRKIAGGSRASRPWFGFGDFHPVTLAQAQKSFPGPACAESAKLLASLPLLPGAHKELDAARQLLDANATDELLGAAFTARAVLGERLKDYRILQFSTHALLPAELRCQAEPAIVTSAPPNAVDASGALLTASQVVGLDLDADLVILSACNSGGPGGTTAGESLSGLGARLLLCRSALADGYPLVGERSGGGVPGRRYVAAHEGQSGDSAWPRRCAMGSLRYWRMPAGGCPRISPIRSSGRRSR